MKPFAILVITLICTLSTIHGQEQEPLATSELELWEWSYGLLWIDDERFVISTDTGLWMFGIDDLETPAWHLDIPETSVMAISSDARFLALTYIDHIEIWEIENKQQIKTLTYDSRVRSRRFGGSIFSPDNEYFLLGHPNSSQILIWDWRTGEQIASMQDFGAGVQNLHFTPDGTLWSASGQWSVPGEVWRWDLDTFTGEQVLAFGDVGTERTAGLVFDPHARFVIYQAYSQLLQSRSLLTGELLFSEDTDCVDLHISSDGQWLLCVGWNNLVDLRQIIENGTLADKRLTLMIDPSMEDTLSSYLFADFNPSCELIAIVLDQTLELWEVPETEADIENEDE